MTVIGKGNSALLASARSFAKASTSSPLGQPAAFTCRGHATSMVNGKAFGHRLRRAYATEASPSASPAAAASSPPRTRSRFPSSSSSSSSGGRPPPGGVKVGTLFLALSILGLGATSVGLYNYYTSLTTFPKLIRVELRSALRCKASQDYVNSHKFFGQAMEKIRNNEEGVRDELDVLKISGISIAWSEMLEEAARRNDGGALRDPAQLAYDTLKDGFDMVQDYVDTDTAGTATVEEKMRGVAMAVKLSEFAEDNLALEDELEKQLTWAIEQVLHLASPDAANKAAARSKSAGDQEGMILAELGLPPWVSKTDLGGTLEALGNLYARKGNLEYAMPLYLQTISLLMPPPDLRQTEPSTPEKCHAATIMNNLSTLIASSPNAPSSPEMSSTAQARAWASKALAISQTALQASKESTSTNLLGEADTCKPVTTVALYNLGMLALVDGNKEEARVLLDKAKESAQNWKLKEAEVRASEVLKTL